MSSVFVLDACALIAFLNDEPGKDTVREVLRQSLNNGSLVIMSKLNILEVYYDVYRRCGEAAAADMLDTVAVSPIFVKSEISDEVLKEAGRLKASYRISIADSIALAETSVLKGSLLTSDHHEFDAIEKSDGGIRFHWIR